MIGMDAEIDTKKEALLLFSGGKDSFLSGCCLIERNFKIYMVTFENGTGLKASNVEHGANRIMEQYGKDKAEFLGVHCTAGIWRNFFLPYFNMKPSEVIKEYGELTVSQFNCLTCRSSMYIWSIIEEILRHEVNIIQMPCPESQLGGYKDGLKRGPKSIVKYDTPEFREVCQYSASEVTGMIKAILSNDYEVVAILGIEFSPSCSIKLQYSNRGVFHQPGIFIESLKSQLAVEKIEIPFVGINRRGMKKSLRELKELLSRQKNLLDF